jgi:hypothetical protein
VKTWAFMLLFILGLAVALGVSAFQNSPGYMDADYYMAGGQRLADGFGFREIIIWNYLDDPSGLPHPSNTYWMPLTSILAMATMLVSGLHNFYGGRLAFILLAGCLPPATYLFARKIIPENDDGRRNRTCWIAALLAVFPGFYLPFLATSDTFVIGMLLGILFLGIVNHVWVSANAIVQPGRSFRWWALLGVIAGLLHLARVDGILWVGMAGLAAFLPARLVARRLVFNPGWLLHLIGVLVGYLVIMGPWMLRNLTLFGVPFSPGGQGMLWLTNYNELFIYPARTLSLGHWLQQGLGSILQARISAFGQNLATLFAVQGEIFLAPLVLLGIWRIWRIGAVKLGLLAYLLIFAIMTLVFPYAGARGGLLHSGAVVQPLFWVLAAVGLEVFLSWGVAHRNWVPGQAGLVFAGGLLALAMLVSGVVFVKRMFNPQPPQQPWDADQSVYRQVNASLLQVGADGGEIVMVNNPPAYYLASGGPAISIPFGDLQTILAVAKRYHANYLALEFNQLTGTDDLYANPGDRPGLHYLKSVDSVRIYEFENTR